MDAVALLVADVTDARDVRPARCEWRKRCDGERLIGEIAHIDVKARERGNIASVCKDAFEGVAQLHALFFQQA